MSIMRIPFGIRTHFFKSLLVGSVVLSISILAGCKNEKIDFSSQVKPIINKHCISCHGGVKRSANFSLLFRKEALDTVESGKPAIIPFDAKHSEMIRRLTLTNPEERMPYKEEPLTKEEIDILKKWIDQGAEWGDHWAYVPPKPITIPDESIALASMGGSSTSEESPIDYFVQEKLADMQMDPSPRADKETLLRRVYLDITGLPPNADQVRKFMEDESENAYAAVVDELLASPSYGEKWASWWLDLARYSDTKGYERDVGRTIWRYRDWVIKALNDDMPFDQFTIEQLAGDLLPNPTDDQLIATAFHRNTMNNDEGGTEDEEYRVAALLERVGTTWEVWQSTTMACVQCHTHPYDPFVHEEFYQSMAFFNNTRDEDTHGEHPNLRMYRKEDSSKVEAIRNWVLKNEDQESAFAVTRFLKTLEPKYHPHDFDEFINGELIDTKWLGIRNGGSARLRQINLTDKDYVLLNHTTGSVGGVVEIRLDKFNGELVGKANLVKTQKGRVALPVRLKPTTGAHDLYFIFKNPSINSLHPVSNVEWFAFRSDLPGKDKPGYDNMEQDFFSLLQAPVDNTPIMIENGPEQRRTTHVFERGNWLVPEKEVQPETPASLNPFPENLAHDRLGFAYWLLDPQNPLTSRVIVNRIWEQLFGYGIVESLEDFGTQGAKPTHPELLDWMALQMMNEYSWSLKELIREIVMSDTYCQDSRMTAASFEADPTNRWLARGPRVRLSAEQVRDQALAVSGLLSDKMYGKSVMPYQPEGIWNTVYNNEDWEMSEGEDQFRRSVYIYSKRTSPYPSMIMFDGSSREVCVSRRIRTNTPLQALVTLNDSSFVVASRSFAERMLKSADNPQDQIRNGYAALVIRDMPQEKLEVVYDFYKESLENYSTHQDEAEKLMVSKNATPEEAAMTTVAQVLLNLDEVIMKE